MKTQMTLIPASRKRGGQALGRALLVAVVALVLQGCSTTQPTSYGYDMRLRPQPSSYSWERDAETRGAIKIPLIGAQF